MNKITMLHKFNSCDNKGNLNPVYIELGDITVIEVNYSLGDFGLSETQNQTKITLRGNTADILVTESVEEVYAVFTTQSSLFSY